MEILVTIAIIGLLSTIATVAIRSAKEKTRIAQAKHEIDQIYRAITMLANDSSEWPNHQTIDAVNTGVNNEICGPDINTNTCVVGLDDQAAGIMKTDGVYSAWSGPYMSKMALDPWDHEYFFDTDYSVDIDDNPCLCGGGGCTDAVVVGSYGPDGEGVPSGGVPGAYSCDDIIRIIER